jgi:hypothetical protein
LTTLVRDIPERHIPACGGKCGAHRLHRVFRFAWDNPSASRKDAAKALGLSIGNVRGAFHQLRKRDLTKLCPECFQPKLLNGACQNCGFEPEAPVVPIAVSASSQSPTNNLHPGNELGSEVDYTRLGFTNHGLVLKRRIERGIEDPLIRAVKSDVENELKRVYPDEAITDEAGRLVVKEVVELRARYPGLVRSKNARKQLAQRVMDRLRLLHPFLPPHLRGVTALLQDPPGVKEGRT